jgi:probable HAF family extracellular repeat protein
MRSATSSVKIAFLAAIVAFLAPLSLPTGVRASAVTFRELDMVVSGVSSNGRVVVGYRYLGGGSNLSEPLRWTDQEGITSLQPGLSDGAAYAVNGDGSVAVGRGPAGEAYRWTSAGGSALGRLPGTTLFDQAVGVSGDGSVIAGVGAIGAQGESTAFRWTAAGGLKPLPLPAGVSVGFASGVSADGSVVVGSVGGAGRWSGDGTFFSLGTLPGLGQYGSHATAVNADGSIVVGWANYAKYDKEWHERPFRWTAAEGMVGLPTLRPEGYAKALAMNGDGSVIVGTAGEESNDATIWTAGLGTVNLQSYLVQLGAEGLGGWTLTKATGISADGSVIVGIGTNPAGRDDVGWIATIPEPTAVPALLAGTAGVVALRRRSSRSRR